MFQGDVNMCLMMTCYSPIKQACVSSAELRAASGTTCGNHKVRYIIHNVCFIVI